MVVLDHLLSDKRRGAFLVLFAAILFILPFSKVHTSIPVIGLVLLTLVNYFTGTGFANLKANWDSKLVLPLLLYYWAHILGLIYTNNLGDGLFDLQLKVMVLLLPWVVLSQKPFSVNEQRGLLWVFILSCTLHSFLAYGTAIDRYLTFGYEKYTKYTYEQLLTVTGMLPSYVAMYVASACLALVYLLRRKWTSISNLSRGAHLLILLNLMFFLLILAARGPLLAFFIVGNLGALVWVLRSGSRKWMLLVIWIVVNGLFLSLFYNIPVTRKRFALLIEIIQADEEELTEYSGGKRILIWQITKDLIAEHPIIGVGTGDATDELVKGYNNTGLSEAAELKLNTHNQYLHTLLTLGIVGFGVYLYWMLSWFALALRRRQWLFLTIMFFALFNMLTENVLQSNGGLMFFMTMAMLLLSGQSLKNKVVH